MPEASDVVLAGGGLASSLIALWLKAERPDLRVVVLEKAEADQQAHTWSFFQTDVSPAAWRRLAPLAEQIWPGYAVRFPEHERELGTTYAALTEARLRDAVRQALGSDFHSDAEVVSLTASEARCVGGRSFRAPLVIDGRGAVASPRLTLGWQKFLGLECETARPHGVAQPVVMDADVRQQDGYRFLYLLPFEEDRLLIEDTRYSDTPSLDCATLENDILRYARASGFGMRRIARRERGVLPVVLGGDIDRYWAELASGPAVVGVRAVLFHPTTGYSLPEAVRTAEAIVGARELNSSAIAGLTEARSRRLWRDSGFYRVLNRMMFRAAAPHERYRVLEKFYRLPQPLIERFYAGRLTGFDRLRILTGKPPVPVVRALAAAIGPSS